MQIVNPLLPFFTFPIPIDISKFTELTKGIYTDMLRDAPTRISIRESKTFNTQRTLSTWITAHWGENLPTMECSGNIIDYPGQEAITMLSLFILRSLYRLDKQPIKNITKGILGKITSTVTLAGATFGDLLGRDFTTTSGIVNTALTTGMSALSLGQYIKRLTELQATDLAPTYILHDNYIYQGYFTDFSYTRDINQARKIQYQFKFNIEWNSANYLTDMIKNAPSINSVVGLFQ